MRNDTRALFNTYLEQLAKLNGVPDVTTKFSASPSVEQTLEKRIQESSAFLQLVNSYSVDQQTGEKIGLSIGSTIASRTDTNSQDRQTQDPSDTDARGYACKQTNFDTHLGYAKMDAWAKFPNFQAMIRDMILRQQALDRIMIGWNGTSAAATTNRGTYPLLQDVNIGWLAKLQTEAAARYMTEGTKAAGEIRVGPGDATAGYGDYANMDQLVQDMRSSLLGPWHARNNNFTALCGSELVDEKYFPLIGAHGDTPTESQALDLMLSNKKMGGLRVGEVPFFPDRSIMVTLLDAKQGSNLSIYHQEGTRRRHVVDKPERDRIENYESVNEAYVIEDLTACCGATNIKLWDPVAKAWY